MIFLKCENGIQNYELGNELLTKKILLKVSIETRGKPEMILYAHKIFMTKYWESKNSSISFQSQS